MLQLTEKPYNLLWIFALLLLVAGLMSANTTIDIHLHDTYFIFPMGFFIWLPALFLLLFWLFYVATNKLLFSKTLSWIHIVLTILASLLILIFPYYISALAGMPRRYNEGGGRNLLLNATGTGQVVFEILVLALAAGQIVFISNLLIGMYKRARK